MRIQHEVNLPDSNNRAISALKIRPGVFSEESREPTTAHIVKEDSEFNYL